jgi:mannose-6-phosphate isomerase-like protein (cupin superfamily)
MRVIRQNELPFVGLSHEFVGKDHGVANSIFFVTAPPGRAVALHCHDYHEIIVVQEGRAACTVGSERREVSTGDIIVIPARTPHGFASIGDRPLRQIDIHASPEFVTNWL